MLVHACPRCGFAGDARAFEAEQADEQVRAWVLGGNAAAEAVRDADSGYGRYQRAALCQARRKRASALQIGEFYLAASWSAQLEGAPEEAPPFQAEAARYLERALLTEEVGEGERAVMTYLVGELRRRLGEFEAALQLFDQAAVEFTRHDGPRWLLRALGQQAGLAKEKSAAGAALAQ
jgi:hypothetical protein